VLPGHVSGSSCGQAGVARTVSLFTLLPLELTAEDICTVLSKQHRNYLLTNAKKNPTRQVLLVFIRKDEQVLLDVLHSRKGIIVYLKTREKAALPCSVESSELTSSAPSQERLHYRLPPGICFFLLLRLFV